MATEKNDQNKKQPRKPKKPQETKEPQKITIELYKYKTLIDALEDPKKVSRVIITVFLLGVLLFAGITVITVAIKRLYPYSDITTNGLGATTIKNEKKEVSYWLFNTATLWANSGIDVKKGDIITIRASGKSHTAIHHLHEAALDNTKKTNDWVGSEGEFDSEEKDPATYARRRFRIFPDMPSGALLMQIVTNEAQTPPDYPKDGEQNNFFFIGKERQNIYINNNGRLHFAVNDIILDRSTIINMMWENIRQKHTSGDIKTRKLVDDFFKDNKKMEKVLDVKKQLNLTAAEFDKKKNDFVGVKTLFEKVFEEEIHNDDKIGVMRLGLTHVKTNDTCEVPMCELSYYYGNNNEDQDKKCKTVWFDDNIGSFLIVVEKTN